MSTILSLTGDFGMNFLDVSKTNPDNSVPRLLLHLLPVVRD